MKPNFNAEVRESQKKRKPKKARGWCLGIRAGIYDAHGIWLHKQNEAYLNTIDLDNKDRRHYEDWIYRWKETDVDIDDLVLSSNPEQDAYLASLRAEAEMVYEENLRLFKLATRTLTEKQKLITTLYLEGNTFDVIGKILNTNGTDISNAFYGNMYRGQRRGGIISEVQTEIIRMRLAADIIKLRDDGLGWRDIGKQLGCGEKTARIYYNRYRELL